MAEKVSPELERGARALARAYYKRRVSLPEEEDRLTRAVDADWPSWIEEARACISAALEQPSEAMRDAVVNVETYGFDAAMKAIRDRICGGQRDG